MARLIAAQDFAEYRGRVTRISGKRIEARGPLCRLGDYCEIDSGENTSLLAEVVAVDYDRVFLMPLSPSLTVKLGAEVVLSNKYADLLAGDGLANRAIDAMGRPIDGGPPAAFIRRVNRQVAMAETLDRVTPGKAIATGIRVIDTILPVGEGQRIGIFAASGVGKTSLVEQLSQQISCDHVILCLVGERGREVEALWTAHKGKRHGAPVTIVAATSDESATMRVRAVEQALAMAEHWRTEGKHVVLFIDSITRLALALRELGLAAGEPPTLRALTPNVFAFMPQIVERCGAVRDGGAITAIFTVLSETDDVDDPIVELMKSLLDGHIILSRRLAERGHFPSIDVSGSVSRLASRLLDRDAMTLAVRAQALLSEYEEAQPMIESGVYRAGSSRAIDEAIATLPKLNQFLKQATDDCTDPKDASAQLRKLLGSEAAYV